MNKSAGNGSNTEDIKETAAEEKILVFNPAGFVIKLIISIVFAVVSTKYDYYRGDLPYAVFNSVATFAGIYAMATLFGLALRLSRNFLVAIILFAVACVGYGKLFEYVSSNAILETIFNIVFTIILIAIIVRDIRKAVLYFRHIL